jgi:hypothetical protein
MQTKYLVVKHQTLCPFLLPHFSVIYKRLPSIPACDVASLSSMPKQHTSTHTPYLQLHHFGISLNSLSILKRSNIAW